jgi:hypothetical protein
MRLARHESAAEKRATLGHFDLVSLYIAVTTASTAAVYGLGRNFPM